MEGKAGMVIAKVRTDLTPMVVVAMGATIHLFPLQVERWVLLPKLLLALALLLRGLQQIMLPSMHNTTAVLIHTPHTAVMQREFFCEIV
jgi:hypothetical protein